MLRSLPLRALLASLCVVGCFAEPAVQGSTGGPDASDASEGTTPGASADASGDVTAGATDASTSGTATSSSASDSADTTQGADDGSGTSGGSGSGSGSDTGVEEPLVCPSFFDTFDDGVIDPRWRQAFASSSSEVDGELVVSVTGELNDQYVTMVVLPENGGLEGGTMVVELGAPPVEMGVRTTLWVQPTAGAGRISYNLASRSGGLRLEARITPEVGSPQVLETLDWDPRTMGWLQLREVGGTLYFERSADGVTFETFHEMATPFDVSSAEVGFAGHNDLELASDVEISVRSFAFTCG